MSWSSRSKTVAVEATPRLASGCQPAQRLNDSTVATPATKQLDAAIAAAVARRQRVRRTSSATTSSSSEIADASAATNSSTKNATAASVPNGICANASGRVTNTRPGPPAGSSPCAKTIGNTASPASSEISVSATTATMATCRRLTSAPL